jgi:hypothetical protein
VKQLYLSFTVSIRHEGQLCRPCLKTTGHRQFRDRFIELNGLFQVFDSEGHVLDMHGFLLPIPLFVKAQPADGHIRMKRGTAGENSDCQQF